MYGFEYDLTPPIFGVLYVLIGLIILRKNKKSQDKKVWIHFVFLFYVLVMVGLIIFPIYIPSTSYNPAPYSHVSFIQATPLFTIKQMLLNGNWFIQILGNIGVCLPVSFFLYYYIRTLKFSSHLIFGILLSVMFEFCQFIINVVTNYPNRVIDIDDVILNATGVMLGYIAMRVIKKMFVKVTRFDLKEVNKVIVKDMKGN